MPRIPEAQPGVQLNPLNAPNVQGPSVSPSTFLGTQTEVLNNIAGGANNLSNFLIQRQNQVDVQKVLEAETLFKRAQIEKSTELKGRLKNNAEGVQADANQWWESMAFENLAEEIGGQGLDEDKLTETEFLFKVHEEGMDDAQRQAFKSIRNRMSVPFLTTMGKHESGQLLEAAKDSYSTSISSSVEMASQSPDKENIFLQADRIKSSTRGIGAQLGWDKETTDRAVAENLGKLHVSVFNSLMSDEDIDGAKEYLEVNRAGFLGETKHSADRVLRAGTTKRKALVKTREIMRLPRNKQDDAVFAINDPELQEQVRTYVTQRQGDIDNSAVEDQNQAVEQAVALMNEGAAWETMPETLLIRIPSTKQAQLRKLSEQKRGGVEVKTDLGVYAELSELSGAELAKVNIAVDHVGELSRADSKHFIDLQTEFREGKESSIFTSKEVIDSFVDLLPTQGVDSVNLKADARKRIESHIRAAEEKSDTPLTVKDVEDLTREVMTPQFLDVLEARYREEPKPAADTFTISQQLNAAFRTLELTGVDNTKTRGQVESAITGIITQKESGLGRRLRDEERAVVIQSVTGNTVRLDEFGSDPERIFATLSDKEKKKAYVEVLIEEDATLGVIDKTEKVFIKDLDAKSVNEKRQIFSVMKAAEEPFSYQRMAEISLGVSTGENQGEQQPEEQRPFVVPKAPTLREAEETQPVVPKPPETREVQEQAPSPIGKPPEFQVTDFNPRKGGKPFAPVVVESVNASAAKHNIDPNVLMAMIAQESNGDPLAVKADENAVGLLQIRPQAAKEAGIALIDRTDPAKNIEAGAKYFNQNLNKIKKLGVPGNHALALAIIAHNTGPTIMSKAIRDTKKAGEKLTGKNISRRLSKKAREYSRLIRKWFVSLKEKSGG